MLVPGKHSIDHALESIRYTARVGFTG